MRRDELTRYLEDLGAVVQNQVTRDTDILIVGDERGDVKYNQAMKYGTTILPWPMIITLGILEPRSKTPLPKDIERLIRDTVFLMVRQVDSTYAHFLSRKSNRLRRAFFAGAEAIDSLLRGTWGRPTAASFGDIEEDPRDFDEDIKRCFRECVSFWAGMVTLLEREVSKCSG